VISLKFSFDDLAAVRALIAPEVYQNALNATVKRLSDQVATVISREVRANYPLKQSDINKVLRRGFKATGAMPERILSYYAARVSLRHFASKASPKIKTARGVRYGVKVKIRKSAPLKIKRTAFKGKSRAGDIDGGGAEQIFARIDQNNSASKLKKLTGPSASQMVRGKHVIAAVDKFLEENRDRILQQNIYHFLQKHRGVR